jgi:hypothetical protein
MLKRTIATSLITGEQFELFEPVAEAPDEVEQLLELNAREGRLRERMIRRVMYGNRQTSVGEVSL